MVDMQEKTDREVFHVKYPVRCLNLEELREYRKEQLADSYYEPFVLKLKYEGEVE